MLAPHSEMTQERRRDYALAVAVVGAVMACATVLRMPWTLGVPAASFVGLAMALLVAAVRGEGF